MKRYVYVIGVFLFCLTCILPIAADSDGAEDPVPPESAGKPAADLSNEEAGEVISEMTEAMNLFAERINNLASTEDFVKACNEYAETVERIGNTMFGIIKAHPEWGEKPPDELEHILADYSEALGRYDPALNASAQYANTHSENNACRKAMKRLNSALYNMYQ